jgi:hypothetical protein
MVDELLELVEAILIVVAAVVSGNAESVDAVVQVVGCCWTEK